MAGFLYLVMHSRTRQIVAMQVGSRNKETAEKLFFKLHRFLTSITCLGLLWKAVDSYH